MTALIGLTSIGLTVAAPVPTLILKDIDLEIAAGERIAIVGPSGAGKSSLASIIGTLQPPTQGSYLFRGTEMVGRSRKELADFRSIHVGFVFQQSCLIDERTALANVELGILKGDTSTRTRAGLSREALARVGLEGLENRRAGNLSGGERHRVAIARALVKSPTVVIADEPTASLDQTTGKEILDLLAAVTSRGSTLIVVSHDERAAAMSNQVVSVLDGEVR